MSDSVQVVYDLILEGRASTALGLIEPRGQSESASLQELAAYANVLKALDRNEESLSVFERAVQQVPSSSIAEHNLAAMLEKLGRHQDAEVAAKRSVAKGGDAAETWAVLARSLQAMDRHDEAEMAYREALRRRPTAPDVQRDLAQLIWMRTGDADSATEQLRSTIANLPFAPELVLQLGTALRYAGHEDLALAALEAEIQRAPGIWSDLEVAAASTAAALKNYSASEWHAIRAVESAPGSSRAILALADAYLAQGRWEQASKLLGSLHQQLPDAQQITARLATAMRLLGDVEYAKVYDYDAMVAGFTFETPAGWNSHDTFLDDLANSLRTYHTVRSHPFNQSLRNGTQTQADLTTSGDPVIKAFFQAIDAPIRMHIEKIGTGTDPLRKRNTGHYRFHSAWSVRLKASGFHVNHVHQYGWLSSVCHVAVPTAVNTESHEGWLTLGEPGIPTHTHLTAERYIKPERGRLVLFPSYMWHGTVPFTGDGERLSIGIDIVPS